MPAVETTIRTHGTMKTELIDELRSLPRLLTGTLPDRKGYGDAFRSAFTFHLFTLIHKAFLQKSDGGTDDVGESWKPLKKSTIAQRPLAKGEYKKLGLHKAGRGGLGLLSSQEVRLWKGIFKTTFLRLLPKVGEKKAKAEAGKLAWAILKSRGARTKLETLGNRKVPILIASGELEKSLKPGQLSGTSYTPPSHQVLTYRNRSIRMGTDLNYASYVHKKRRLWPPIRKMKPWIRNALEKAVQHLTKTIRS